MTRMGRIVVALGSIAFGVIVLSGFSFLVGALLGPDASFGATLIVLAAGMVIFGFATAAAYTWTMNGPFVFRCNRARFAQKSRSAS